MIDFYEVPFGAREFLGWIGNVKGALRQDVRNKRELLDLIDTWNGVLNCGVTVSTKVEDKYFLLYLPFDFDSEDLSESMKDGLKTYNFLVEQGYECAINFSGKKGFHVFAKTRPKMYSKHQVEEMQNFFRDRLSLNTMDSHVTGDFKRIMRLPGTFHMNGGDMCIPIAQHEGKLLDMSDFYDETHYDINKRAAVGGFLPHPYPCVEKLVIEDPEPEPMARIAWTVIRLVQGKSPEEIITEISKIHEYGGWEDFDIDKSLYHINYLINRGYTKPVSCYTLRGHGYCLGEECPYYILMSKDEGYVPKRIENK